MFKKLWDWVLSWAEREEVEIEETPMNYRSKDGTEFMVPPTGTIKRIIKNPDGTDSIRYFRKKSIKKSDYGVK